MSAHTEITSHSTDTLKDYRYKSGTNRIGMWLFKYPDQWHYSHFEDPHAFFAKSNMPTYGWLKHDKLDAADVEVRMKVNGFPYTKEEMGDLAGKNELDALVAYMQVIVTAGAKKQQAPVAAAEENNPRASDAGAIKEGKELYKQNCEACHGDDGKGGIGPSLRDKEWLKKPGDISDGQLYGIIAAGTDAGMPGYDSLARTRSGRSSRISLRWSRNKEDTMAEDFERIEDFEAKETSRKLPIGWLLLFWALIVWGVLYLWLYTPGLGGWSQEKAYHENMWLGVWSVSSWRGGAGRRS